MLDSLAWDEGDVGVGRYKADIAGGALKLAESRRIAALLLQGVGAEEWQRKIETENILQKTSPSTARRQASLIRSRLTTMDAKIWRIVAEGPARAATHALFAAAIKHSALFADFLPIVRERFRVYKTDLPRRVWVDYVERCRDVDPKMPEWKTSTIDKLGDSAYRILQEAGFLAEGRGNILRPVLIAPTVLAALHDAGEFDVLQRIQVSS
ncbi:DUF1819 family protein [Methylobacterium oxalidis]|uniref:DUF1819 family protein n=1 Tax=Methylobacterium oxalidis TaxID=944322 RepID=UPI00331588CF